ncbi:MAG: hypothetical protein COT74_02155 [Bdellovibrionales bacterium CG10_big_fil_rev_8_21_14_0_10_45_34]|nr:MAG: hypothetical protein COT74_02155 [Bdellovibrionales bacterium CG10_big_fil_rev_8_21_14_0_10_45_34]
MNPITLKSFVLLAVYLSLVDAYSGTDEKKSYSCLGEHAASASTFDLSELADLKALGRLIKVSADSFEIQSVAKFDLQVFASDDVSITAIGTPSEILSGKARIENDLRADDLTQIWINSQINESILKPHICLKKLAERCQSLKIKC